MNDRYIPNNAVAYMVVFLLWICMVCVILILTPEAGKSKPIPVAREFRLMGYCDGKLLAGMEEDDFPEGCDWIEAPIYSRKELP